MRHLKKYNESDITSEDKSKLVYDATTKTMTGFYKVLSTDDKKTILQNDQEKKGYKGKTNIGYLDGMMHGDLKVQIIELDTSLITIHDEVDEEGLTKITFPYWMYSLHKSKLQIWKLNKKIYRVKTLPE